MRLILHQEKSNPHYKIWSPTILHLLDWIEALEEVLNTDDCPFESADELATQLEFWRAEFQKGCGNRTAAMEEIKVMTYGEEVVLICKEETGEFIKLTVTPSNHE